MHALYAFASLASKAARRATGPAGRLKVHVREIAEGGCGSLVRCRRLNPRLDQLSVLLTNVEVLELHRLRRTEVLRGQQHEGANKLSGTHRAGIPGAIS